MSSEQKSDMQSQPHKSVRLKDYDYSSSGYYFVTICTDDKQHLFGQIVGEEMKLNTMGEMAQKGWYEITKHRPEIELDEFVVMPNHIHGIIIIKTNENNESQYNKFSKPIANSLSMIINQYKGSFTKWCNENDYDFKWQPSFYEHIIRNEESYNKIATYILENPIKWGLDEYNY